MKKPTTKDYIETVQILAGLSLFVVVDITDPQSSRLELQALVPHNKIPFILIIQKGKSPFSMIIDLISSYDWMLTPFEYSVVEHMPHVIKPLIIDRAGKNIRNFRKGSCKRPNFCRLMNS